MNENLKSVVRDLVLYVEFHSENDIHQLRDRITNNREKRRQLERDLRKLNEEIDLLELSIEDLTAHHEGRMKITTAVLKELNGAKE